jgi:hypothetical protein
MSSTRRLHRTWTAAIVAAPRDAVIETKSLLRGARAHRSRDERLAAERAATAAPAARPGRGGE